MVGIEDWFAGVETWIIDNQATHWLFVYILNPIEDTASPPWSTGSRWPWSA